MRRQRQETAKLGLARQNQYPSTAGKGAGATGEIGILNARDKRVGNEAIAGKIRNSCR
jgi:hypothetical protein